MRRNLISLLPVAFLICMVIPAMAEVPVGSPAPDFTLKDVNNDLHSLSDFQGKVVIIFFWQDI